MKEKYYLIEEYTAYGSGSGYRSGSSTEYKVRTFSNKKSLEEAILRGPQNKGKFIAAKDLEIQVQVIDDDVSGLTRRLTAEDYKECSPGC